MSSINHTEIPRARWLPTLVAGAFFMENLDGTVITTALPQMAHSFGVAPLDLGAGVSAYLLTLGVLIPISGWVAGRFGARRVFAAALALFTLASLLCGMAGSMAAFVALRVLQGGGGAMMVPAGTALERRPFDWPGFALSAGAISCLTLGGELAGRAGGLSPALACLACGGLLLALTVRHLRRTPHPLIDLDTLQIPTFSVTIFGGSLFRMSISAVPFLLPLMFQIGFGLTAFKAGLLVIAVFAGNLAMKMATTPLLQRFGFRTVMLTNGQLNVLALLACALLTPQTPLWLLAAILFIGGMTRSMQFTALNTIAFADMPQSLMPRANTLFSTAFQVAMGLGVALGASAVRLGHELAALLGVEHAVAVDFRLAFVLIALLSLLSLYDTVRLPYNAAGHVSHQKTT